MIISLLYFALYVEEDKRLVTFSFKMSPLRNGREQAARSQVQPDLEKERQNCPFSQEEVTNLIDGGAEKTAERRSLEDYFFSHTEV